MAAKAPHVVEPGREIKPRHMVGGLWRAAIIESKGRASRTFSKVARVYFAKPPAEGWPGGDPLKNGYRPSGGK